jgi:hypothetical protein
VVAVELLGRRRHDLSREVTARIPNRLLLGGQVEIHVNNPYMLGLGHE